MTPIQQIYKSLKFISDGSSLTIEQIKSILPVLTDELAARDTRRVKYLLVKAGLKPLKKLEDFDWLFNPKIPREEVMRMAETPWDREIRNFVLIGPTGVGKTHLAKSSVYRAVLNGIPATCVTCNDLIEKLKNPRNKTDVLKYYATVKLLCIDEVGYVFPDPKEANDIFQIISKRSELTSTIVTTNLIPSKWGKIFEAATASGILDRLSLNGRFITCNGRSYRDRE